MNKAPYTIFNLSLLALILLFSCSAKADIYIKIGSGYKLIETEDLILSDGKTKVDIDTGGKLTARIEIGAEKGKWTYGLAHRSQWLSGFPFNDDVEFDVTEVFVDYKWTL